MSEYISKESAIEALRKIRIAVWDVDIPSPTVPEYVEHHEQMQEIMRLIDRLTEQLPTADVIPCEFLERYADWFCAWVPYTEFVREAKLFYQDTYKAMEGGGIASGEYT